MSAADTALEEPLQGENYPEGDAERQSHFVGCFVETVFLPLMDLIHFCDLVGTVKEELSKIFFPSKFFVFCFL